MSDNETPKEEQHDCDEEQVEVVDLGLMRAEWAQEFLTIMLDKYETPDYMSEDDEQTLINRSVRLADGLMDRLADGLIGENTPDEEDVDPELN